MSGQDSLLAVNILGLVMWCRGLVVTFDNSNWFLSQPAAKTTPHPKNHLGISTANSLFYYFTIKWIDPALHSSP